MPARKMLKHIKLVNPKPAWATRKPYLQIKGSGKHSKTELRGGFLTGTVIQQPRDLEKLTPGNSWILRGLGHCHVAFYKIKSYLVLRIKDVPISTKGAFIMPDTVG